MRYEFADFVLDTGVCELRRGPGLVPLEPQVFDVLEYLIRHRDRVVSRDDLIASVWHGRIVSESALSTRINAARAAIGDTGSEQRLIKTLPRKGLRFVGTVREEDTTAAAQADVAPAGAPALPDKASIAVLPFQNMSGDPEQDYFCDGMVEDIITGLSRIKWLFVISRNSTFAYKSRGVDVKQVGRELGVRYVLEGSVRKATDRIRISGQLIDATTAAHVWAERYDRKYEDVFALQDEITLAVTAAIEPSLRLAEIERIKRKRPESLDAYDLVLRAQPQSYTMIPEHAAEALVFLERALALEPSYALAHAHAAICHHTLFLRAGVREENRTTAVRHARAAIAHGQDDAVALTFAGFSIGMDGHDRAAARVAFEAALAISPSSALTYIFASVDFAWSGHAERAIDWANRGLRLSPLDPLRFGAFDALAIANFHCGRYDDAADAARKAIQVNPGFSVCHVHLAAALAKLGRLEEAQAAAARALELHPTFRFSKQFAGVACTPSLATSMAEALRAVGLPE